LDRGRFVWPVTVGGVVALTAPMRYLPEAIGATRSANGGHRCEGKDSSNHFFVDHG
jgi:hypothetical protein